MAPLETIAFPPSKKRADCLHLAQFGLGPIFPCNPRAAEGGFAMLHANTDLLIAYWRARRGMATVMPRSALDPTDLAPLLERILIAGRLPGGELRLRLVGEWIARAHARARLGDDLLGLWGDGDRAPLRRALEATLRSGVPVVARADAGGAPLEITFIPLAAGGASADRLLALYQPTSLARTVPFPTPLRLLELIALAGHPTLRLAALDGRRIA
jgi:hypothetical protein